MLALILAGVRVPTVVGSSSSHSSHGTSLRALDVDPSCAGCPFSVLGVLRRLSVFGVEQSSVSHLPKIGFIGVTIRDIHVIDKCDK